MTTDFTHSLAFYLSKFNKKNKQKKTTLTLKRHNDAHTHQAKIAHMQCKCGLSLTWFSFEGLLTIFGNSNAMQHNSVHKMFVSVQILGVMLSHIRLLGLA